MKPLISNPFVLILFLLTSIAIIPICGCVPPEHHSADYMIQPRDLPKRDCTVRATAFRIDGTVSSPLPVTIVLENDTDVDYWYMDYLHLRPSDLAIVQVDHNGRSIAPDSALALERLNPAEGVAMWSASGGQFDAHRTYVEQIDLAKLFRFSKTGLWYFSIHVRIRPRAKDDGRSWMDVVSPPIAIVVHQFPLTAWEPDDDGSENATIFNAKRK